MLSYPDNLWVLGWSIGVQLSILSLKMLLVYVLLYWVPNPVFLLYNHMVVQIAAYRSVLC